MTVPLTREMEEAAERLNGEWWGAEEEDNPFGVDLLVCPCPASGKDHHLFRARATLYTLAETRREGPTLLTAQDYARSPYYLAGWTIFKKGKLTMWTLPRRFEYDNMRPRIREVKIDYEKLARQRKEEKTK